MTKAPVFISTLVIFFQLFLFSPCCGQPNDSTYASPGGKLLLKFRNVEQGLVHEWDGNYIKYLCTFTNSQSGASFQGYYYDNVDKDKPPTNLNNLYGQFIWSPHEDFVIFPYEVGQDAPGTVQYDILSLNPALPWKDTSARMSMDLTSDSLFWLDSLTAIYNAHNDCDYGVDMFNGHKGEVITIRPSESPVGYNIVGLDSEMVVLITTFDNCIPLEDIKSFQPKIVSIKISTLREKYIH